jgi:hypothetical protein
MLGDPEMTRALGCSGRAYIELVYRWPHVMRTLEAFLAALAGSAPNLTAPPVEPLTAAIP